MKTTRPKTWDRASPNDHRVPFPMATDKVSSRRLRFSWDSRSPSCASGGSRRPDIGLGGPLCPTGTTIVAIVLQLIALFRSLRLEDNSASEYQKTVRWFIGSAVALLLGLLSAVVEFSTDD